MQRNTEKIFFDLEIIASEFVALNSRFYWEREYLLSGDKMLKNSLKIKDTTKTKFLSWFPFREIKNMKKILPWRSMQCFGPFNMLTVHKCYDTGLFGH